MREFSRRRERNVEACRRHQPAKTRLPADAAALNLILQHARDAKRPHCQPCVLRIRLCIIAERQTEETQLILVRFALLLTSLLSLLVLWCCCRLLWVALCAERCKQLDGLPDRVGRLCETEVADETTINYDLIRCRVADHVTGRIRLETRGRIGHERAAD